MPALLAASERAAAQAWLGYTPAALSAQAPAEQQQAQPAAPSDKDADAQQMISGAEADNGELYSMIVAHLAGLQPSIARSDATGSQALASTDGPADGMAGSTADSSSRRQQAAALLAGSDRAVIRCVAMSLPCCLNTGHGGCATALCFCATQGLGPGQSATIWCSRGSAWGCCSAPCAIPAARCTGSAAGPGGRRGRLCGRRVPGRGQQWHRWGDDLCEAFYSLCQLPALAHEAI